VERVALVGDASRRGAHAMAGVIICDVWNAHRYWARLYVEPVEQHSDGIDAEVREMTGER
jgi:hypothetical protein